MRVLVTGASAPLGRALVERLAAEPDVALVLAVGREPVGLPEAGRVRYRGVDLTRARALRELVRGEAAQLGIDAVVSDLQHRATGDRGKHIHAQNVDATRELVLACQDHPTIRRLVHRSTSAVYALDPAGSSVLDEDAPLAFEPGAPQWLRDRVEADLTVCAHLAASPSVAVLRLADIHAAGTASVLWDFLQAGVCLRPLGFDPMVNLLSLDDAVSALVLALRSRASGVFNIPGRDTLPLSMLVERCRRPSVPIPGPLLSTIQGLRQLVTRRAPRFDPRGPRLRHGRVLDGQRAREQLGYTPRIALRWPEARWERVLGRLAGR